MLRRWPGPAAGRATHVPDATYYLGSAPTLNTGALLAGPGVKFIGPGTRNGAGSAGYGWAGRQARLLER